MKTFFSIVIPTLNEEKFLPSLLKDLTMQTNKNFEVIICDALSTDNTKKEAHLFNNKLNLKFLTSKKKNVSNQRNLGAAKSQGQYILFLDADSHIKRSFIDKAYKKIIKQKGLLFIPYIAPEKGKEDYQSLFNVANSLVEFSQTLTKKFSLGGSMIFERNFFNILGGFDEKLYLAEDHELVQRAAGYGVRPKFLRDNPIYFSFRRFKREGDLRLLYKFVVASAYRIFGGEIKNKIFEYNMEDIFIKN